MPKSLLRLIALLLIPCLLVDPALAGVFSAPASSFNTQHVERKTTFESQALTLLLLASLYPGPDRHPFILPKLLPAYAQNLGHTKKRRRQYLHLGDVTPAEVERVIRHTATQAEAIKALKRKLRVKVSPSNLSSYMFRHGIKAPWQRSSQKGMSRWEYPTPGVAQPSNDRRFPSSIHTPSGPRPYPEALAFDRVHGRFPAPNHLRGRASWKSPLRTRGTSWGMLSIPVVKAESEALLARLMKIRETIFPELLRGLIEQTKQRVRRLSTQELATIALELKKEWIAGHIYDALSQTGMMLSEDALSAYGPEIEAEDGEVMEDYETHILMWEVLSELSRRETFDESGDYAMQRWLTRLAALDPSVPDLTPRVQRWIPQWGIATGLILLLTASLYALSERHPAIPIPFLSGYSQTAGSRKPRLLPAKKSDRSLFDLDPAFVQELIGKTRTQAEAIEILKREAGINVVPSRLSDYVKLKDIKVSWRRDKGRHERHDPAVVQELIGHTRTQMEAIEILKRELGWDVSPAALSNFMNRHRIKTSWQQVRGHTVGDLVRKAMKKEHKSLRNTQSPYLPFLPVSGRRLVAFATTYGYAYDPIGEKPWARLKAAFDLSGSGWGVPLTRILIPEPNTDMPLPDDKNLLEYIGRRQVHHDIVNQETIERVLRNLGMDVSAMDADALNYTVRVFQRSGGVMAVFENTGINLAEVLPRLFSRDRNVWQTVARNLGQLLRQVHKQGYEVGPLRLSQFVVTPELSVQLHPPSTVELHENGVPMEIRRESAWVIADELAQVLKRFSKADRKIVRREFLNAYFEGDLTEAATPISMTPIDLEESQAAVYQAIRDETAARVKAEKASIPFMEDGPTLDVDMVAGHSQWTGAQLGLARTLEETFSQMNHQVGALTNAYMMRSPRQMHMRLFQVRRHDQSPNTPLAQIHNLVQSVGPFVVHFIGPTLMPDGTLIAEGYVEPPQFKRMRDQLSERFPDQDWKNRPLFYLVLAEPKQGRSLTRDEFKRVHRWTLQQRRPIGDVLMQHPFLLTAHNRVVSPSPSGVIYERSFHIRASAPEWQLIEEIIPWEVGGDLKALNVQVPELEAFFGPGGWHSRFRNVDLEDPIHNAVEAELKRYREKETDYEGWVTIRIEDGPAGSQVITSDNGEGFSKRGLETIFKGVSSTKNELRGVYGGAGAAIVTRYRPFVEQFGGEIEFVTHGPDGSWRMVINSSTLESRVIEPASRAHRGTDVYFRLTPRTSSVRRVEEIWKRFFPVGSAPAEIVADPSQYLMGSSRISTGRSHFVKHFSKYLLGTGLALAGEALEAFESLLGRSDWDDLHPRHAEEIIYACIKILVGNSHPLEKIKRTAQEVALEDLRWMDEQLQGLNSREQGKKALSLAVRGNRVRSSYFREHAVEGRGGLHTYAQSLKSEVQLEVDDREQLLQELDQVPSKEVLYILDNVMEDVYDLALIRWLLEQGHHVVLVVKSAEADTDVTREDLQVLLDDPRVRAFLKSPTYAEKIRIITSGSGSRGTDLRRASSELIQSWIRANVIIVKGQGNRSTLVTAGGLRKGIYSLEVSKANEESNIPVGMGVVEYIPAASASSLAPPARMFDVKGEVRPDPVRDAVAAQITAELDILFATPLIEAILWSFSPDSFVLDAQSVQTTLDQHGVRYQPDWPSRIVEIIDRVTDTPILSPEEGIKQLKKRIDEAIQEGADEIIVLVGGLDFGIGKSTFVKTASRSLHIPGWGVEGDDMASVDMESSSAPRIRFVQTMDFYSIGIVPTQSRRVIKLFLTEPPVRSENIDVVIDWRSDVRPTPAQLADFFSSAAASPSTSEARRGDGEKGRRGENISESDVRDAPLVKLSVPVFTRVSVDQQVENMLALSNVVFPRPIQELIRSIQARIRDLTVPELARLALELPDNLDGAEDVLDVLAQLYSTLSSEIIELYRERLEAGDPQLLERYANAILIWEVMAALSRLAPFDPKDMGRGAIGRWLQRLAAPSGPNVNTPRSPWMMALLSAFGGWGIFQQQLPPFEGFHWNVLGLFTVAATSIVLVSIALRFYPHRQSSRKQLLRAA
jgi:uncharacterized protein with ATP-grasp and redox domains